ncbi:hemerythrin domain-containing protein [Aquihabitans sp. G128]|nr:hemerythrin domain-containing protein [Aquihabitans sp. G128]
MDAITLLKDDHRTVEKLFKRFEKAGDGAYADKRQIADRICEELSKHAAIEEMLFYPVTRATVPETEDIVLESLEEHHIVKWVLSEIDDLDPHDERFDAKVTVLIENVRHHVKEEEEEYFPQVREELGRKALAELGDAMVDAKKTAPTHPHPRAPRHPSRQRRGGHRGRRGRQGDRHRERPGPGLAGRRPGRHRQGQRVEDQRKGPQGELRRPQDRHQGPLRRQGDRRQGHQGDGQGQAHRRGHHQGHHRSGQGHRQGRHVRSQGDGHLGQEGRSPHHDRGQAQRQAHRDHGEGRRQDHQGIRQAGRHQHPQGCRLALILPGRRDESSRRPATITRRVGRPRPHLG